MLSDWLEPIRKDLEKVLPRIKLPQKEKEKEQHQEQEQQQPQKQEQKQKVM